MAWQVGQRHAGCDGADRGFERHGPQQYATPSMVSSRWGATHMLKEWIEVFRYRELVRNLVSKQLKIRYKRSVLGLMWALLYPLLMMVVMNIVFSNMFQSSLPNFPVYLLSGIVLWNFFSQTTMDGANTILTNVNIIKKIYVPKGVFSVATVLSGLVHLGLAVIPLLIIALVTGTRLTVSLLFLPVSVMLVSVFILGVSLALATIAVFFNDILYIYQVLLIALMFLTPIFYPASIVPPRYVPVLRLNPMYYFVECFRLPIYEGTIPAPEMVAFAALAALIALLAGWWLFSRNQNAFVYYL
jgi:ABC-type polysaccharide/polyol phosphate export permease